MKKNFDKSNTKVSMVEKFLAEKTENADAINGIKYYYFGQTYTVMNSKTMLSKKKKNLLKIVDEVNSDVLLQNPALKPIRESILDIIYNQIERIDFKIQVKKFRVRFFKFNIFGR